MTVGELCTREVVVAKKDDGLLDVARRMRDHHVGSVVVIEDNLRNPRPIGILTDRDIVVEVLAKSSDVVSRLDIGDVMSEELVTTREQDGIDDAVAKMRERGVRRLPVVDAAGGLVGILSLEDVLESLSEQVLALASISVHEQRREREARP